MNLTKLTLKHNLCILAVQNLRIFNGAVASKVSHEQRKWMKL